MILNPTSETPQTPFSDPHRQRLIGTYGSDESGPVVACVAGIHGNEPAGVHALERVLTVLRREEPRFRGKLHAFRGNLKALEQRRRFVDEDLNRAWHADRVRSLESVRQEDRGPEEDEIVELNRCLEEAFAGACEDDCYFVDLHTTSSLSVPFAVLGDTLRNRTFALKFSVPVVLGVEEQIDGSIDEYQGRRGRVTFAFEAGMHDDPASVDLHEAAVWSALLAAGCLEAGEIAEADRGLEKLAQASSGAPRVLEIRYRHGIDEDDEFVMLDGFANFSRVERGQLLAHDRHGEIRASESGMIFMPLYQSQGNDGFFIARPVRFAWLRLSKLLRKARVDRIVHWLPGVSRHPHRPNALIVNREIARWFAVELFHLLGYRKERCEDGKTVITRRRHGTQ